MGTDEQAVDTPSPGEPPSDKELASWEKEARQEELQPQLTEADKGVLATSTSDAILGLIVYVHALASDLTSWEGWALNEQEKNVWSTLAKAIGNSISIKNLPLYMAMVGVAFIEISKTARYIKSRRRSAPPALPTGKVVASTEPGVVAPVGPVPLSALGGSIPQVRP